MLTIEKPHRKYTPGGVLPVFGSLKEAKKKPKRLKKLKDIVNKRDEG